ncbi:MAG: hypothetical protein KatS3mg068_2656 [Candidatus Sericytochromatia bacterium]|nr:MAG: hypothetical protein KatS3mg068_2656 [Candidatus Sericytochromatia bacterium]GIX42086.1 MAG: hypothetical protein KatS3mg129_1819 [Leptospiraceae bacterium]
MKFINKILIILLLIAKTIFAGNIAVLLPEPVSIYQQFIIGLQSSLNDKISLNIYYLNNPLDIQNLRSRLEVLDVIITIGLDAYYKIEETGFKKPILIALIPNIHLIEYKNNLCGIDTRIPISEYLSYLNEIIPEKKIILTIYTKEESKLEALEGYYSDIQFNSFFIIKKANDSEDFKKMVSSYTANYNIDAFYVVDDPIYTIENLKYLVDLSRKKSFALITKYDSLLNLGLTFSLNLNYSQVGRKYGEIVNKIVFQHNKCEEIFFQPLKKEDIIFQVNIEAANKQKINIPEELVERSNLYKISQLGIDFFYKEKYSIAEKIFNQILEKDPQNPLALYFKKEIITLKTKQQTDNVLNNALKHYNNKNYKEALTLTNQILKINPYHEEAKNLNLKIINEYSNLLESYGDNSIKKDPYMAIKYYLDAIDINSNNDSAKNKLFQLRNQLKIQIPKLLQTGKNYYEKRMYKESIEIFNKILLIEPGHRLALEYKNLAIQKLNAIRNIINR